MSLHEVVNRSSYYKCRESLLMLEKIIGHVTHASELCQGCRIEA